MGKKRVIHESDDSDDDVPLVRSFLSATSLRESRLFTLTPLSSSSRTLTSFTLQQELTYLI